MKISLIVGVFIVCLLISSTAFAEQMIPGTRWKYMRLNSSGKSQCVMKVSTKSMRENWLSACSTGISNWNNYSDNKVSITIDNSGSANVELLTYGANGHGWPYDQRVIAFTMPFDNSGRFYSSFVEGSCAINEFSDRIRHAGVIFNPNFSNAAGRPNVQQNLAKVITHELGHCMNMGHPSSSSTQTVMKQGWSDSLTWSDFDRPQIYDYVVLTLLYDKIYS